MPAFLHFLFTRKVLQLINDHRNIKCLDTSRRKNYSVKKVSQVYEYDSYKASTPQRRSVCALKGLLYLVNFATILIFLQFVSIDNFFLCQQLVEVELLKSDKLSNFKILNYSRL